MNEIRDKVENVDAPGRKLKNVTDTSSLPRERAVKLGINALSDAEIIAILLGTGIRGKNVLDLANEILMEYDGHLSELLNLSVEKITTKFSGIGRSKALLLLAAVEIGRRAAQDHAEQQANRKSLRSSQDCYNLMKNRLSELDHEEVWITLLNNSLKRITDVRISLGATTSATVEVKNIVRQMIDKGSNNVILFHNHPSGQLKPSANDDALTRKIKDALKLFDFKVIDHLIITSNGYYSYCDEGRL